MNKQTADMLKAYRDRVAALDASFDAGIEQNRKENANIKVVDRAGKPLPNVHVALHQEQHDFSFGCNGVQIGQKGERNEEYEQAFARLFNLVTTTVCWAVTEVSEGHFRLAERDGDMFRRPPLDRIVAFGKKYGIRVKGQPLMADSWWPDWASRDAETLKKQWVAFLRVMGELYADKVDVWDVVNDEDFGFEEGGDGKAEADCHTRTVAFYRGVDVFLYAGELDDVVELALDLMLGHAEDGTVHEYVLLAGEFSVETGTDLKE